MISRNVPRDVLPPIVVNALRRVRDTYFKGAKIRFAGDYATWAQAESASSG
jgi:hypothetical protein